MLLANFDRKEHLQHRAVSLRQHGFLVVWYTHVTNRRTGDSKQCATHLRYMLSRAKNGLFFDLSLVWLPRSGNPLEVSDETYPAKTRFGATVWWKFHNPNFNRFCMLHPCDGQTDGRAIAHSALSIYAIWCRTLKTVGFLALKTYTVIFSLLSPVHRPQNTWPLMTLNGLNIHFYPRDAMLARVIAIATCLSVCLSVRHAPVLCQNEES